MMTSSESQLPRGIKEGITHDKPSTKIEHRGTAILVGLLGVFVATHLI